MPTTPNNIYGWIPDKPDQRDLPYNLLRPLSAAMVEMPTKVDLRDNCPPVFNQGALGSCTAQAIAAAYEMELRKHAPMPDVSLSRLFIYYNERLAEGTVEIDAGAYIRDGIKSIAEVGVCLESLWPYVIADFAKRPPDEAYLEALNHQAILYASVSPNYMDVMTALADGYPVVFGFTVYESFESEEVARTGLMPFPKNTERAVGGHAVLAVGYDQEAQHLLVRNSWGSNWGQDGYFWMPFSYIQRLARDFWIVKQVE